MDCPQQSSMTCFPIFGWILSLHNTVKTKVVFDKSSRSLAGVDVVGAPISDSETVGTWRGRAKAPRHVLIEMLEESEHVVPDDVSVVYMEDIPFVLRPHLLRTRDLEQKLELGCSPLWLDVELDMSLSLPASLFRIT
jgi:hypothetical protein